VRPVNQLNENLETDDAILERQIMEAMDTERNNFHKDIDRNTKQKVNKGTMIFKGHMCSLCLEDFNLEDKITITLCKHSFHTKCFQEKVAEDVKEIFIKIPINEG